MAIIYSLQKRRHSKHRVILCPESYPQHLGRDLGRRAHYKSITSLEGCPVGSTTLLLAVLILSGCVSLNCPVDTVMEPVDSDKCEPECILLYDSEMTEYCICGEEDTDAELEAR